MKIGVIGPSDNEIMEFINKICDVKIVEYAMLKFYIGNYEGVEVVAVICGVCKVNAAITTQILIDKFEVTHVILTGVAGGLDKKLKIGDTIISNDIAHHDVSKEILIEYHPYMKDIYFRANSQLINICEKIIKSKDISNKCYVGRIITGERFITNNEREELIERFNPLCVDMESASVAHACYVNNIPFVVIRSISDNADEDASNSFKNNVNIAALNSMKITEEIIKELKFIGCN
ncbi:5'-methylthioadenosine/adenosylhomocysteine nucleosidase [Clostridium ihumii]|uniref:5'-methylthioadenosine/adenosylhomocysteine nucleosidase n=1 Tax=Clostridium ihumii TaxID=1470356 RepID=UPI0005906FEB|nr:5'-methylthioadenosine/adenosylhomocysteine nucleosidase [Clostridium ihumii]